MVESFELAVIIGCNILYNPLDIVLQTSFYYISDFLCFSFLMYYIYEDTYVMIFDAGYLEKGHVVYDDYKLCF